MKSMSRGIALMLPPLLALGGCRDATGSGGVTTASLQRVSADAQTVVAGLDTARFSVRATDRRGRPVPGVRVSWEAVDGPLALVSASPVTDAAGEAHAVGLATGTGVRRVHGVVVGVEPAVFEVTVLAAEITVTQPRLDQVVGDTLEVAASARGRGVLELWASVENERAVLSGGTATLPLGEAVPGPQQLRVVAVVEGGDSSVVTVPFTYDGSPRIRVTSPVAGEVARDGRLTIDAACLDGSRCTLQVIHDDWPDDVLLATGTPRVQQPWTIPPPASAVGGTRLLFRATDDAGNRVEQRLTVFSDNHSPRWREVFSAGTRVADYDGQRVAFYRPPARARWESAYDLVLRQADGTEHVVDSYDGLQYEQPFFVSLHARGVLIKWRNGIYNWQDGQRRVLTWTYDDDIPLPIRVAGALVSWQTTAPWPYEPATGFRNMASGVTWKCPTAIYECGFPDVAANGDAVVDARRSWALPPDDGINVYRVGDGGMTLLAADGRGPRTDGTRVVFYRERKQKSQTEYKIVALDAAGERELSFWFTPPAGTRLSDSYHVAHGWVVWRYGSSGGAQYWSSRSPGGDVRIALRARNETVHSVGPGGEVLFYVSTGYTGRMLLARPPYTAPPIDVGTLSAKYAWIGSDLYAFHGRTVFRVDY